MKTLVTGSTGFIGRHVVNALYERGRALKCLVRQTSKTNCFEKLDVELVLGNLLDKSAINEALNDVDVVINLAGEVYTPQKELFDQVNVIGLKNLLSSCLEKSVKKLIHLSSSSSVGPNENRHTPVSEDTICRPITHYGNSKLKGELIINEFFRDHNFPAVILRPPLVYGPCVSKSSRVLMFLNLINRGRFIVVGKGNNLISLCYIDDLIQGILKAEAEKRAEGQTYFIADERPYAINEIARTIAKELGKKIPRYHLPVWLAEILSLALAPSKFFGLTSPLSRNQVKELTSNWFVDISKAKRELGYKPTVALNEGIAKTANWFRKEYLIEQPVKTSS